VNHNGIPHDQGAMDRGIRNRQIKFHQDLGDVRGEIFFASLGSASSSRSSEICYTGDHP
jgi:hypothetical protein